MIKKIIKPEDLPEILTNDVINILVEMCEEFPKKDFSWVIISNLLKKRNQLNIILDIVEKKQRKQSKEKIDQQSLEEKEINRITHENMLKKIEEDFDYFYGNMGRPDTLEEYKERIENHLKNKEKKNNKQ